MTTPLWALAGFAVWTVLLVAAVLTWRSVLVLRGERRADEFTPGVPHGSDAYWRFNRAHQNAVENLPIFASLVLVATVSHLDGPPVGQLALVVLGARLAQSLVHFVAVNALLVTVRFTFMVVQVIAYVFMLGAMLSQWRSFGV